MSRPVEFNIRYDRYATLHRWSERFDPIVDITRTATNSVLKKITRPVARGRSRIAETTLPKTRGGDEWRQIDIAINERETEHFPRTVHAKILVAHSWHTFLQLALRSIDPRIDLILLESCCSRSCFSNLVAMDANEEKGREDHVRHAYAARKVEIDERGNTRFVARERVDLEDCWLATRFTPTLRLCISGCVRSTRRPSSSVFVAPERDLRPHGWW